MSGGRRRYAVILRLDGLAGSPVKDVARGMVDAAKRLDMAVSLDMNGTHLLAFPDSTLGELQEDYETQIATR